MKIKYTVYKDSVFERCGKGSLLKKYLCVNYQGTSVEASCSKCFFSIGDEGCQAEVKGYSEDFTFIQAEKHAVICGLFGYFKKLDPIHADILKAQKGE